MVTDNKQLIDACKNVLDYNWRRDHTIPSRKMYPHQWLWDSCFVAIGLRNYDTNRAKTEIIALLKSQWSSGMVPHMIFDPRKRYAIERWFWNSKNIAGTPKNVSTSCITQPPMLAEAIVQIGKKLPAEERKQWYEQVLPALVKYHLWLYRERDPDNDGTVLLIHPYESGLDNSPPWLLNLKDRHHPWWLRMAKLLPINFILNRIRRDIGKVKKKQRISNIDALLYIDILWRYRRKKYDIKKIIKTDKFLVENLSYNCILLKANKHLQYIAKYIDVSLPDELQQYIGNHKQTLEIFWDDEQQDYFTRSYNTLNLIKDPTIASLLTLYSGAIPPHRAKLMVKKLRDKQRFNTAFPVPSVSQKSKWFSAQNYWQGPTWINTNWLIIQGLHDYGYHKDAEELKQKTIELVATHGSYEYFSPLSGRPLGAKNFSWTAALIIDLMTQE